jgi:uncharacterized protein GlcG (DUF336 family)
MSLMLANAQSIISFTLAEARRRKAKPLAVIVLDAGGNMVAFAREDGAGIFRGDIAKAKALGALGMGENTRAITERAKNNSIFFDSLSSVLQGQIVYSPGGVLIRHAGKVIGSIGISGDTGDCDEACGLEGISLAGFGAEIDA